MPMPVSLTSMNEAAAGVAGTAVAAFRLVAGPHGHRARRRRELDGVLDQVPEDLLEADRVGLDVVARGGEVNLELEPRVAEVVAADLDDVVDELVGVDDLTLQDERAAPDASQVEEVVDQPGFQQDVSVESSPGRCESESAVPDRRAWR